MSNLTTPSARKKAREFLLQSLYQWELAGQDIHTIEAQFYAEHNMDKVDREYYRELLHRIPATVDETDGRYQELLDRRLDELDPISKSILRIGSYEMAQRIDVPYKVVINEAVNLAKKYGPEDSQKYINAVMDKLAPRHRKDEVAAMRKATAQKPIDEQEPAGKQKPTVVGKKKPRVTSKQKSIVSEQKPAKS